MTEVEEFMYPFVDFRWIFLLMFELVSQVLTTKPFKGF